MRDSAVVDASVAVKWFVPELGSNEADALATIGLRLVAPSLIRFEVANAFARKAVAQLVTPEDGLQYVGLLPRYLDDIVDAETLLPAAMDLAVRLRHPIYDCVYLGLARERGTVMVTADKRLLARLEQTDWAPYAVLLDGWRPEFP